MSRRYKNKKKLYKGNSIDSRLVHRADNVTDRASADHFSYDDRCFNRAWHQALLRAKISKGKSSQQNKGPKFKKKKQGTSMAHAICSPQGKVCMPPTYVIVGLTQSPNAVLFILNETDLTVLTQSLKKNHSRYYG